MALREARADRHAGRSLRIAANVKIASPVACSVLCGGMHNSVAESSLHFCFHSERLACMFHVKRVTPLAYVWEFVVVPSGSVSRERPNAPTAILTRLAHVPIELCLLPAVLIVAVLFRFDALTQRGLIFWDEGKFSLEGLNLYVRLESLLGFHSMALTGKTIGTAKPTHALLIALSYAVLGVHDYAPLMLDATASVLQVGLVFLLARRLFGVPVALLATLLLAVSGYDILYARSALSESDANLFFMGGVLVWSHAIAYRGTRQVGSVSATARTRLLAGFLIGLGFTTNYRLIVYIAVLVGLDLAIVWRRHGWRSGVEALALWIPGVAICPVLWEFVGLVARGHGVILFRSEITYRPTSYFSEVLYQIHGGRQSVVRFNPLLYVEWYRIRQGWPMLVLLGAGIGMAAVRRSANWLIPTTLVVMPYVLYSFAPVFIPRNLDMTIPFSSIVVAAVLVTGISAISRLRPAAVVLLLLCFILSAYEGVHAWRLTAERSGFAEAALYVRDQGTENALIVNEVLRFYLRDSGQSCDTPHLPATLSSLAAADRAGDEYVILDRRSSAIARYLIQHARPVKQYLAAGPLVWDENVIASENGYAPWAQRGRFIDVYTLDSFHLLGGHDARSPTCALDRVT
jgi:4-amino-4-deoxy-L-arabinose transferase-like glycosyltransferase